MLIFPLIAKIPPPYVLSSLAVLFFIIKLSNIGLAPLQNIPPPTPLVNGPESKYPTTAVPFWIVNPVNTAVESSLFTKETTLPLLFPSMIVEEI